MRKHQLSKCSPATSEQPPFPGGIRLVLTLLFLNLAVAAPLSTAQSMEGTTSLTNLLDPSAAIEQVTGSQDSHDGTTASGQVELIPSPGSVGDPLVQGPTASPALAASAPVALSFYVYITPCRVADTRNPAGPFGGPIITGGASRNFMIPNSACNIPPTATAYSLNVAVVPSGSLGYLTLWPTGQTQPFVATLNSYDGRIKSTAAIIPAGTNGSISAFATDTTHVVIDINGYFTPIQGANTLEYYPVTPCRVADTRNPTGPLGGPAMVGQSTRTFPILSSPCGLSSTAIGLSANFAAVPSGPLDFLTAWPTGVTQPYVATLNDPRGTVVANAAIVTGGTGGAIDVYATQSTNLVIDVNGYFAPGSINGLDFYPVTPCRVADTRLATGPLGGPIMAGQSTRTFPVLNSSCGVPATAGAYVFNVTAVPTGPLDYITVWPQGQTQPNVATLNAYDGAVTSNMAIVPTNNGSINMYVTDPTHVILDLFGYFGPYNAVVFSDYPGTWAGSWQNNTFGSSGPATLNVTLNPTGTQMTWTISVQGNVFGGASPPPETFIGTVTASGITLTGMSAAFGNLLLNIDPNGGVTGSGTNVNSSNVSRFDFLGTWTKGGFNLNYTATLKAGGTANGTFLMNKL